MKKMIVIGIIALLVITLMAASVLGGYQPGPAPNSGDGIPDGSGWDAPPTGNNGGKGPAPNSGDGIPDGSGF